MAQPLRNLTGIYEDTGLIPGLSHWVKDLVLLWLWCRMAAAAPIRPLVWELPCATGATLKRHTHTHKGELCMAFQTTDQGACSSLSAHMSQEATQTPPFRPHTHSS